MPALPFRRGLEVLAVAVLIGAACAPPEPVPAPVPGEEVPPRPELQPPVEGMPPPAPPAPPPADARPMTAPATAARWTASAPLPEPRTEVSVTTDGRYIYLAGGFGPPRGEERATAPRTLWRYDPEVDRWDTLTQIPEGVHHAAFVHLNRRLYLIGGFRETSFQPVGNVRIFDLRTNQWCEGAPMPTPRGAIGFTVLEGHIHLLGGNAAGPGAVHDHAGEHITEDRSVNTHEAYDPATDIWRRLAPMPTARNHLGAAALYGKIHAVVGRADGDFRLTTHEIYDPLSNSWHAGPPVPTGRSGVAVVEHVGHLYVFGGETFGDAARTFDDAERFDPRSDRWERLPPMPTARHGLGAAPFGRHIYVISGGPQPGFSFGDFNERVEIP